MASNIDLFAYAFPGVSLWVIAIVVIWSLVWKGLALWKSARKQSLVWFIVILLVNTAGILEILYMFVFSEMSNRRAPQKKSVRKKRR